MSPLPKTYLDLVKACDNFPFVDLARAPYAEAPDPVFYQFLLPEDTRPHGYLLPSTVAKMPWIADFEISVPEARPRTVKLLDSSDGQDTTEACNAALARVIQAATEAGTFTTLSRLRNEDFKILGARYPTVQLRRAAAGLFGIACRGAHMTVFTRTPEGLKIWVPRRSAHLFTWPGKLDTTVAGGVRAEESPFECIVHEADEEASLPESLVRERAKPCGAVTYVCESERSSGGEVGLMVPDVLYVYDLEVGEEIVPRPQDDEVEAFYLWDVEQVKTALFRGEFKTNCASVMIDFFIRHGIITDDNEPDYLEILTRLHRPLPVPTSAA
ncbi:NUDIX domain-containing protein [Xylariaceae sp. FL0662B]|nr:NUDIX domain-containing protein [Xylariaceae sp. FL0662B]